MPDASRFSAALARAVGWAFLCHWGFVAGATAGNTLALRGHDDGRLEGQVIAAEETRLEGLEVTCRNGATGDTISTRTDAGGMWSMVIPEAWRAQPEQVVQVTVGAGEGASNGVFPLWKMPLPFLPAPAVWAAAREVDEPESAFDSLGRTLWHFGRNAELIERFHEFLRERRIEPTSLLDMPIVPPLDTRRIVIEPELAAASGWSVRDDRIETRAGDRGPTARLPLTIDRGGLYRGWVRYTGYAEGVAVSSLTIARASAEEERPLVNEEFHTRVAGADGPCWHEFLVALEPGEHVITLGCVINYHHTAKQVPRKSREVDCVYLTDEIWRGPPSDEERAELADRVAPEGCQRTAAPPLDAADIKTWKQWQVRPCDWEAAPAAPRLFAASYDFWRHEIDRLATADYRAPPLDPVAGGIADYRDQRRQVICDPVWNMVGNPHRISQQRRILEDDIDPLATDATFDTILPGEFPVVQGQWKRQGGGLSADHAATKGLAAGVYTVPRPGRWHLWVAFKNINYFEHFGIRADTLPGQAVAWERTDRLYPGGRLRAGAGDDARHIGDPRR